MSKVNATIISICAVVIAIASVFSALGGTSGLLTMIQPQARSKIIEDLVRTEVELTHGLNQAELHRMLIDIDVEFQVSKIQGTLSRSDQEIVAEFIGKLMTADQLWSMTIGDGLCEELMEVRGYVKYATSCVAGANQLLAKLGFPALSVDKNGASLELSKVRQPALEGADRAVVAALKKLVN